MLEPGSGARAAIVAWAVLLCAPSLVAAVTTIVTPAPTGVTLNVSVVGNGVAPLSGKVVAMTMGLSVDPSYFATSVAALSSRAAAWAKAVSRASGASPCNAGATAPKAAPIAKAAIAAATTASASDVPR